MTEKPSREQILSEPAGPRLDELVATLVMGWTEINPQASDRYWQDGNRSVLFREWRPSENVGDAWRVVEWMSTHSLDPQGRKENPAWRWPITVQSDRYMGSYSGGNWIVQTGCDFDEPWGCDTTASGFWGWRGHWDGDYPKCLPSRAGMAASHELPLAISRAALLAVLEDE